MLMPKARRQVTSAKAVIGWTALGFLLVQLALDIFVVSRHPELRDPEYATRLARLRERMAENPQRPLMVMLGSSRTVGSFIPEKLPAIYSSAGESPLVFNFSHLGAGPGMNMVEARRLLRDGIRPKWMIVEVMPPQLNDGNQGILLSTSTPHDLSVTRRYRHPLMVYSTFVRSHLVPSYNFRQFLAHSAIPGWIPEAEWQMGIPKIDHLGGDETLQTRDLNYEAALSQYMTTEARKGYEPALQNLQIADLSDRATRDLLRFCKRRGITVVLLLTPEGSAFQSWYSAESRRRVESYCSSISNEYRVPLIDARNWLADDDFVDSHHVNARGAEKFTLRLGREVIQPLANGDLANRQP